MPGWIIRQTPHPRDRRPPPAATGRKRIMALVRRLSMRLRRRWQLPERRNHPRHDDRTNQRPDHQRKDRDRCGYEHYARHVSHDFLGFWASRHVEE